MTNDEGGTDDEEFRVAAVEGPRQHDRAGLDGPDDGLRPVPHHKYDPITQKEYYRFFAFFNQTADADRPDESRVLEVWTKEQETQKSQLEGRRSRSSRRS